MVELILVQPFRLLLQLLGAPAQVCRLQELAKGGLRVMARAAHDVRNREREEVSEKCGTNAEHKQTRQHESAPQTNKKTKNKRKEGTTKDTHEERE